MFNHTQQHRGIRRGFTLVEILAVVVILGIASAIIIPQIGSRDDMRVAAAARIIVSDLIYAQNLAISGGTPVYVRFDKNNNRYTMVTSPSGTGPNYGTPVLHPITQQSYLQQFGDAQAGTVDAWEKLSIDVVNLDGIDGAYQDEFTVGFDEIGSPYVWCYDAGARNDLADGSSVTIKAGTFTSTINIAAATGEITVN